MITGDFIVFNYYYYYMNTNNKELKMYKIPGTEGLYVTDELKIIDTNKKDYYKIISRFKVEIDIYGYRSTLPISTIYYIAKDNIYIEHNAIYNKLKSFEFLELTKKRRGIDKPYVICIINTPITIRHDGRIFKIIPTNTRYGIDIYGVVLDIKHMKLYYSKYNVKGYPSINLEDYNGKTICRLIHRLKASAWIYNDDPINKTIVNHIDGDKENHSLINLEWETYVGNNKHAIFSNLRKNHHALKIKNISTGEVTEHISISNACEYMGRSNTSTKHINIIGSGKIVKGSNGSFELKYINDNTPWNTDNNELLLRNQHKKVIIYIDNQRYICTNVETLKDIINTKLEKKITFPSNDFSKAIDKFKRNYKDIPVEMIDIYNTNNIQEYICINTTTNKTEIVSNRKDIINITNGNKSMIQKSIATNGAYLVNGWIVKYNDNKPPSELAEVKNRSITVSAKSDTEELVFSSLREAAKYFNIDKSSVSHIIKSKNPINGYTLTYK